MFNAGLTMRLSRPALPILLLACVLLLTRMLGTHLHFCFDGQEAPVAVHIADGELHHDGHQGGDVDAGTTSAAKSLDQMPVIAVLLVLLLLLPTWSQLQRARHREFSPPRTRQHRHFLPLSHAPPVAA